MWEIAIILGILGTSFFLVYVSDRIITDGIFLAIFKVLMVLTAFATMLMIAPASYHIVGINNGSTLSPTLIQPLQNLMVTQMSIFNNIYAVFLFFFVAYYFYSMWDKIKELLERRKER